MTLILATFGVSLITQVVKKWVAPRWGRLGKQGFVILLALVGGILIYAGQNHLSQAFWTEVGVILAGSQVVYNFVIKNLE